MRLSPESRTSRFFNHKVPRRDGETGELTTRDAIFLEVQKVTEGVPFMIQREKKDGDEQEFRDAWNAFLAEQASKV